VERSRNLNTWEIDMVLITHSPQIRARITAGLRARNVDLDPRLNAADALGRISTSSARAAYVFRTNEEHLIARELVRPLR
jgi:acetate kinase